MATPRARAPLKLNTKLGPNHTIWLNMSGVRSIVVICSFLQAVSVGATGHLDVPTYVIDLDKDPHDRYNQVVLDKANGFNDTVWEFYDRYFAKDPILTDVLYGISAKRGNENAEMQAEVQGYADISRLPFKFVKAIQMLYELQTLMVPIVNFSHHQGLPGDFNVSGLADEIPDGFEALQRIPWRGPGCTGIIAKCEDGTVWHARNLDFAPLSIMNKLVWNGIFQKGGNEVFRAQMVAGYTMATTGMRMGPNGFAIERNTRYTDHFGGNLKMLRNLMGGRELNGWHIRKALETQPDYESAVAFLESVPYVSTEYTIISGAQKGCVISRDPDGVAFRQVLGRDNPEERSDYIIITNFDFFYRDVREWFDPTGHGGFGKPRYQTFIGLQLPCLSRPVPLSCSHLIAP